MKTTSTRTPKSTLVQWLLENPDVWHEYPMPIKPPGARSHSQRIFSAMQKDGLFSVRSQCNPMTIVRLVKDARAAQQLTPTPKTTDGEDAMSAKTVCPICDSTGLVARPDIFVPSITVRERCPLGCEMQPPDYANGYRFYDLETWPKWMRSDGMSVCHPTAKTSDGLTVVVDDAWDFNDQETFQP